MPETDLLRAVVLAGGLTFEREVSLSSGTQVVEALLRAGLDAELRDADGDLLPGLAAAPADAVFIALHGSTGEDGAVRAVLDLAGVPYVGSPAAACRLAWDKPAAKSVVRSAGVTTPDWVALPHSTFRELGAGAVLDLIVARLGLPLMVKPASGGSALGAQKVSRVEDLPAAMVSCFAYGDTVLVERFVEGIELAVSVVDLGEGPRALPAVEIVPESGVFDYTSRYTPGLTEYHTPARVPDDVARRAAEVAVTVHEELGLADLSRTDLIVDADGAVHFLEVNVSPGLTETSMFPMAVEAAGHRLGDVLTTLLRQAAARG
ncbi:D-alanine--D-alanine ligase family protein [Klenkia terrae]|jgi:D-alanine-D-alanine ligase|uniref:D-alanine--D-alanine ligase n=1 Tax=Klenkia terrae TaxID=1052259 RepID=A0ABU8E8H6_9ACTN|nr:D-alanine--D-alanine ligase [Klenkia terrae]